MALSNETKDIVREIYKSCTHVVFDYASEAS